MENLLIIIPTYNERKNIKNIIEEISEIEIKSAVKISILIVDDNSPDKTWEYIEELKKQFDFLNLLKREKEKGLGKSYIAGINWGIERGFGYYLLMDGDGSHSPKYIFEFIKYLKNGYDYILGSRYLHGVSVVNWSITRLFISYSANKFVRVLLGLPIRDVTSGFKAFTKDVIKNINPKKIKSTGYAFHFETTFLAYRSGAKIIEFPIIFIERLKGKSKLSKRIILESFLKVFQLKIKSIFGCFKAK